MKLRSGKVSKENEPLKNDSEKRRAKILKRRQRGRESCEVVSNIGSETTHDSLINEDSGDILLRHKALHSHGTGFKTAMKHISHTSPSSAVLTNWSSKSNSTVTRNEDLTYIHETSLCASSSHLGRSSEGNLCNKLSLSHIGETSSSRGSSIGGTAQLNSPLIVDVTNIRKSKAKEKRKVDSVISSIIDQDSECAEMVHKVSNFVSKIPSVKRQRCDGSVETMSRNVKAKISDTRTVPNHNNKCPGQEDDTCSVISLGSDDDVIILDSDPKTRLNCSGTSDVIIIDSVPSAKCVPSPDIVTIDLCTPLSQSDKSKFSTFNVQKCKSHKERRTKRRNKQKHVNSTFKEYVSVLGNVPHTESSRSNDLPSFKSRTTSQDTMPLAPPPSASLVSASAASSSVRSLDCTATATSSRMGCNQMNQTSALSARVYGSNLCYLHPNATRLGLHAFDKQVNVSSAPSSSMNINKICNPNPNAVRMDLQTVNNKVDMSSAPSSSLYGNNLYNPNPIAVRMGLRPIVIDGSNVAMGHTNGRIFSCRGLQICIDYFLKRNHKVIAFVPQFRKSSRHSQDTKILDQLEKQGLVSFTPSRKIGDRLVVPYDDRYIVQYAAECGGVIVSTDNFRDLLHENPAWRETIEKRLLMFTWVEDVLMFPQDPLGRNGPDLERFLRFP